MNGIAPLTTPSAKPSQPSARISATVAVPAALHRQHDEDQRRGDQQPQHDHRRRLERAARDLDEHVRRAPERGQQADVDHVRAAHAPEATVTARSGSSPCPRLTAVSTLIGQCGHGRSSPVSCCSRRCCSPAAAAARATGRRWSSSSRSSTSRSRRSRRSQLCVQPPPLRAGDRAIHRARPAVRRPARSQGGEAPPPAGGGWDQRLLPAVRGGAHRRGEQVLRRVTRTKRLGAGG